MPYGRKSNYFVDGVLNVPCSGCGCKITIENSTSCGPVGMYVQSLCKDCNKLRKQITYDKRRNRRLEEMKEYKLKSKHGLEIHEFMELSKKQNDLCAICGKSNGDKRLVVDHCHKTDIIRELLCDRCNLTLGNVDDSVELLLKMIDYLIRHSNIEKQFEFQHD